MLVQRFWPNNNDDGVFYKKYIEKVKENNNSCDEVWLCAIWSYCPLDVDREYVKKLKKEMDLFKNAGIRVSIQACSIGHGNLNYTEDNGAVINNPLMTKTVDAEGKVSDGAFCWNGEAFTNYIVEKMKIYAELDPYCIWLDDDMRIRNWAQPLRCFCDDCIAKFNKLHGYNYTREQLLTEIVDNLKVREEYVEFSEQGLGEFAYKIAKGINEVNSKVYMGLQCGGYVRYGFLEAIKGFYKGSQKNVKVRPGAGSYQDSNPNALVAKAIDLSWQKAVLPEYCDEVYPEIENYPHSFYSKTVTGTCLETSIYFANGFNECSYAAISSNNESLNFVGNLLENFKINKKYWDTLKQANKFTVQGGLINYIPKNYWSKTKKDGESDFDWMNIHPSTYGSEFLNIGIPITYEKGNNSTYILNGNYAECLSDSEIEFLLTKPVMTDGKALDIINERGFGKYLSATAKSFPSGNEYIENFNDHIVNKNLEMPTFRNGLSFCKDYLILDTNGQTEIVGEYYPQNLANKGKDPLIADAIVHTSSGAKWFVLGFRAWDTLMSYSKKKLIENAINYISHNSLKVSIFSMHFGILYTRENKDGKLVNVSLLNNSIEKNKNVKIKVKNFIGDKFYLMDSDGKTLDLSCEKDGEYSIINIPSIGAWEIVTIFSKS